MTHFLPRAPIPLQASVTLDHVALQAELLVQEIRAAAKDKRLEQRDIDELHHMVLLCNLFLNPTGIEATINEVERQKWQLDPNGGR